MQEPGKLENMGAVAALMPTRPFFADDFDEGVRGLEPEERDAFILTDLRGLTVREAGDVLDTSYETVRRRAESARQSLRKEIR